MGSQRLGDDLIERLRKWAHAVDAVSASDLMDEAADEIERLRGDANVARLRLEAAIRLADQDATLSVCDGNVKVTMDLTLTDEEREAICQAVGAYDANDDDEECASIAATLRSLLERTK
jgi:hypothetical protein